MTDDQVIIDLRKAVTNQKDIREWLDKVYYDTEFSTVFNRPILSFMIQASDFIIDNLTKQENLYKKKKGIQ